MPPLHIDRLSLEIPGEMPGVIAEGGRDMGVEIATRPAAAGALPAAGDYPAVRVEVPAMPNEQRSDLIARIVAEALRQLRRGIG
jgi:hypothetical protein